MGGNVFDDSTEFDHNQIDQLMDKINQVVKPIGAKLIPIGSGATPTPGKTSNDLDVMVDQAILSNKFGTKTPRNIKAELAKLYQESGYQTQNRGVNVHVRVPLGSASAQVDIMVVPHAEMVSKFHTHNIPQGSPYKGVNKQLAIWWLAKQKGMNWSAFKGLINAETKEVITRDLDKIAKLLLDGEADKNNLGSFEAIMDSLPEQDAERMLDELKSNPQWSQQTNEELDRIKQLSGIQLNSVVML